MTNTNLEKGIPWRFGPDWPGQRCRAKTRKGTACQKPALIGKARCRLHGGLSTGPKTPEGKARIAAAHWKHGLRPSYQQIYSLYSEAHLARVGFG